MESTTLCLDVGYRPVRAVPWQEAIVWVLEKLVDVVDEYPDRYIHTVNWAVKVPSVVRFLRPLPRKRVVKFSRHGVYARDGGRCQYCGTRASKDNWTYDHVVPRAQGGKTEWGNVVCACSPCNQYKGGRTPEQAGMRLHSIPVKPKKLPDLGAFLLRFREGMPEGWRAYLSADGVRDAVYWGGELENDEK